MRFYITATPSFHCLLNEAKDNCFPLHICHFKAKRPTLVIYFQLLKECQQKDAVGQAALMVAVMIFHAYVSSIIVNLTR